MSKATSGVHHAVFSIFLAIRRRLASHEMKPGHLVQVSYEQRLLQTSTIPFSACSLQYTPVLLPSTLNFGTLEQESCDQRSLKTSTMPSSTCSLQYAAVCLPSALKRGALVHKPYEHVGYGVLQHRLQHAPCSTPPSCCPRL